MCFNASSTIIFTTSSTIFSLLFSDLQIHFDTLNPSAYLIKEGRPPQGSYRHPAPLSPVRTIPPKTLALPPKTKEPKTKDIQKAAGAFNDSNFNAATHPSNRSSRTRNWCQNLDSTGNYLDSDYISLSSSNNYSQSHFDPYRELKFNYNPHNINQSKPSTLHGGYLNPSYGNYPTYRSNSTRDDDETTTTSGSYTINHEELDDDIAASQYQVSQVV